jgi:hypothetical protein
VTIRKVLCDTDTLLANIRHTDEKSHGERQALEKLLEMRASGRVVLLFSRVSSLEVANTEKEEQRDKLDADRMDLEPVVKEENVSGFQCMPGPTGSWISNPVSDLDQLAYQDCKRQGLGERDSLHILRAVENACDVFMTRDKKIIKHRGWLEQRFPGLKIRKPSELVEELLRGFP